jgi:hypothetical protein
MMAGGSLIESSSNNAYNSLASANGTSGQGNADFVFNGGDIYTNAWADYSATSTIAGWSGFTTKNIYYKKIGKTVFIHAIIIGTSNGSNAYFTVPYAYATSPYSTQNNYFNAIASDNGGNPIAAIAYFSSSTFISVFNGTYGTTFTSSGTKTITVDYQYQSA